MVGLFFSLEIEMKTRVYVTIPVDVEYEDHNDDYLNVALRCIKPTSPSNGAGTIRGVSRDLGSYSAIPDWEEAKVFTNDFILK